MPDPVKEIMDDLAHLIVPDVYSYNGSISFPFASFALLILNTAIHMASAMNTEASASSLPGQILLQRISQR